MLNAEQAESNFDYAQAFRREQGLSLAAEAPEATTPPETNGGPL